jgi:hypothetical protein
MNLNRLDISLSESVNYIKALIEHVILFMINFLCFVGLIESMQFFTVDLPILNTLLLGFMVIHTFILLSIQLGVQILQFIKVREPTVLIAYYFQMSDEEVISIPILDPTKNKLGVIVILLIISGGPIFYVIFMGYGALVAINLILRVGLDVGTMFVLFLNWIPPLIFAIVLLIIISIVALEFRHA